VTYYFPLQSNGQRTPGPHGHGRVFKMTGPACFPIRVNCGLCSVSPSGPPVLPDGTGISGRYLGNPYRQAPQLSSRGHLTFWKYNFTHN
jgi:hypothetical protein